LATFNIDQCFSKWAELPPGGDFDGQVGEKNKGGDRGAKKHQGGENAQSLIDDRVNFQYPTIMTSYFLANFNLL